MEPINVELQRFIAASEHLLADTTNPENWNKMEQDIIQYYLSVLADKFSPSLTKST
jgi:hypothetical protein